MANKAYPPSICRGIPRLGECPKGWTTCTFGDILTVVERPVPIDDEIRALEAKAAALVRQKKGLMQQLLTGKVRTSSKAPNAPPPPRRPRSC